MDIKFICEEGHSLIKGKCEYITKDFSLEYLNEAKEFRNQKKEFLIIYDTLTLVFDNSYFKTFDFYTNSKLWLEKKLEYPETSRKGVLKMFISNEYSDDRIAFDFIPKIEVDYKKLYLRILLNGNLESVYNYIGENIFVGLNEGEIVDIFLTNFSINNNYS